MNKTRQRIHDHIVAHPGVHFNAIVRALDVAPGQVQYHMQQLLNDDIVLERIYGRTHYYPAIYDTWERGALALFRRETTREILLYLIEHGPTPAQTIATDLDIVRSTLAWHVDHLTTQNLVNKQRDVNNQVTLILAQPSETANLLRKVKPSLSDRTVDRFIRFIDALLDGADNNTDCT